MSAVELVASYLDDLTATHAITTAMGTVFSSSNLFLYTEPVTDADIVTLIPYGGASPDSNNTKQEPAFQIRFKSTNPKKAIDVQQAMIDNLHNNQLGGRGRVKAIQSSPIPLGYTEGGEYFIVTTNYTMRHVI
jgi:hypothetical protein